MLNTDQLAELLLHVERGVPFVQANLLDSRNDDPAQAQAWRTL